MRRSGRTLLAVLSIAGVAWVGFFSFGRGRKGLQPELAPGQLSPPMKVAQVPDSRGRMAGVVLDHEGNPAPRARLVVAGPPAEAEGGGLVRHRPVASTWSGEDGRFEIKELPTGAYTVLATGETGRSGAVSMTVSIPSARAAALELRLTPIPLHLLHGTVTSAAGGAVTAFVRAVELGSTPVSFESPPALQESVSGEDGRFEMLLRAGTYSVSVEAPGHVPLRRTHTVEGESRFDAQLHPETNVAIQVAEASGAPVQDATVWLLPAEAGPGEGTPSGSGEFQTDTSGWARVHGVGPGRYRPVAALGERIGAGATLTLGGGPEPQRGRVELAAGGAIDGEVRFVDGRSVPDTLVVAQRLEPPFMRARLTSSAADGRFTAGPLLPGRYRLTARPRSDSGVGAQALEVRIGPGERREVLLRLTPDSRLLGQVVTARRHPVAGVTVTVRVRAEASSGISGAGTATTDAAGNFEVAGLAPGKFALTAQHADLGTAVAEGSLEAGSRRTVNLVLAEGAFVEGTVRTATGEPAANAMVGALLGAPFGGPPRSTTAAADGQYRLGPLPPGPVTIVASRSQTPRFSAGGQGKADRTRLVLESGRREKDVDLVVATVGAPLEGRVLDPGGLPVPGAFVMASLRRGSSVVVTAGRTERVLCNSDGKFVFAGLDDGEYDLWGTSGGWIASSRAVARTGRNDVVLRLRRSAGLQGTGVDALGKPAAGGTVTLMPMRLTGVSAAEPQTLRLLRTEDSFTTTAGPDGSFQFAAVAPGRYQLSVSTAEGRGGSLGVSLEEGEQRRGVRVELSPLTLVTGRVFDPGGGQPLRGVNVLFLDGPANSQRCLTDQTGRFELHSTRGRQARVVVSRPSDGARSMVPLFVPPSSSRVDLGDIRLATAAVRVPPRPPPPGPSMATGSESASGPGPEAGPGGQ